MPACGRASRVCHEAVLRFPIARLVRALPSIALLLAAVAGCSDDDPFRPVATTPNVVTGLGLASLSTGTLAPTALDFINLRAVRPLVDPTGSANFQLALDIAGLGQVRLLPVLRMVNPPSGSASVGLQRVDVEFETLGRAPSGGYALDSTVTAAVGETWVVQLSAGLCAFGDPVYAKLVVDGINTATGRLSVRFLLNRNCGYRDLTEGLPRN